MAGFGFGGQLRMPGCLCAGQLDELGLSGGHSDQMMGFMSPSHGLTSNSLPLLGMEGLPHNPEAPLMQVPNFQAFTLFPLNWRTPVLVLKGHRCLRGQDSVVGILDLRIRTVRHLLFPIFLVLGQVS